MSEFLSSHELLNLEDEIRTASQALYVRKKSNDGLQASLKSLSLRTGWAVYMWVKGEGIMNIKSSEPPPPKTKEFKEAIRFAYERKHFSVFIFPINDKDSWLEAKLILPKIEGDFDGVIKFLFILPKEKSHPFFDKKGKLIEFNLGLDGNFVLRDGKWISANDIQ